MKTIRSIAFVAALFTPFAVLAADAPAAPPPMLALTLKPHLADGQLAHLDGELTLEAPQLAAGATLVRMPLLLVSIPTARYDGNARVAHDAAGELTLTQKDEDPTPTGTYRQWLVSRATSGNVVVQFKAPPRAVDAKTRTGPLFDLRAEGGGLHGAGITFLPLPPES